MSYQPFFISSFEADSGLNTYFESFLIPEKAFVILEDAVCWRGKVTKRPGLRALSDTETVSRLMRILTSVALSTQAIGASYTNADIMNDASINVRNPVTGIKEPYAEIKPGSVSVSVGAINYVDSGADGILIGPTPTNTGTINYVTGELNLAFDPAFGGLTNVFVTLSYFPSLPCMCLKGRDYSVLNDQEDIAFDTKYSYEYNGSYYSDLPSVAFKTWNGSDSDLFWICNYYNNTNGLLYWATNNNISATSDPIRYYDGTTWVDFAPLLDGAGNKLQQCLILVAYKNRLIAMNTWEGPVLSTAANNYVNKIVWSQNGDPTDTINGWRTDIPGRGGYLVAPTNEEITSCAFIRDTLIVKFETSSWKLVYTGNETLPFVFQKVNTDLGTYSPFSLITFDKGVLSVGDKGVTIDDSVNVTRIDRKTPGTAFAVRNALTGDKRVYGVRDFVSEVAYWSYPDQNSSIFPNKVLVYNYVNDSWAKFNDSFTCYGTYQNSKTYAWSDYTETSWESADFEWDSAAEQKLFADIVGGNQQGFVSIVTTLPSPETTNSATLSINAITYVPLDQFPTQITVINHNLQTGQFIKINGVIGTGGASSTNPNQLNNSNGNLIFQVNIIDDNTLGLYYLLNGIFVPFDLTLDITGVPTGIYTGVYWGGGLITVLNGLMIQSKQFSPFYEQGAQCRLGYVDLFLDATEEGQISANVFVDCDNSTSITDSSYLPGTNVVSTAPENTALIPFQANQDKIWHRIFTQCIAQNFSVNLSISDYQMASSDIDASSSGFTMHAMAFYLSKNARLVQ